jgi:hypothetical protein
MKAGRAAGIALFFLAWAVVFTYPLVLRLGDSVVLSAGGDAYLHLWDLWWADQALVDLHQNPFHTSYLYYPTGVSLYYHSLDLLNGVISIPLQRVFGLTVAFNLLLLANLTLDGIAAFWLCKERTGLTPAGLIGGAIFASAPLMGTSVNLGQLDEVTAWWIPLYLVALWRILESPGKPWEAGGGRRATLCAGLCLVGASLATWYFTAGLALLTVVFVPLYLWRGRWTVDGGRWTNDRRLTTDDQGMPSTVHRLPSTVTDVLNAGLKLGFAMLLMAVLLSPLLWGMIRERLSGATYMLPSFETTYSNSADMAGLFLPARTEIGVLNEHGSNVALGWVALALAGLGVACMRRRAWPFVAALAVLVIMSLGPELQVGGADTHIPLPYGWLNNVPFVGASRQPLRFLATAAMLLALLSAYGVAYVLDRWRAMSWSRALVPVALLLVAVECFGIPRALVSTQVGSAYTFIQDRGEPGGLMELPYELWQAKSGLNATVHEKPVLGGYTSRHFPYPFIEGAPGAAQLAVGYPETLVEPDIVTPTLAQTALASLDHYGIRYVVLHKGDLASGRFGRLVSLLGELYPAGPAYEDAEAFVYVTPVGPAGMGGPDDGLPLVGLGKGWHELEENPLRRWTGSDPGNGNAQVWVGIRPETAGRYALRLEAFSYGKPRHLSVMLDGRMLLEKEVGLASETLDIDMGDLSAGDYLVELNVREQPESPPNDRRSLSIGYTLVAVEKR